MMTYLHTAPPPTQRSYSLEGLPDREVLVFKSMVRLLGHRTKYSWVYLPGSTELRVVGEGAALSPALQTPAQQLLTLGTGNTRRPSYLQVPLHANELQAELDRLGALISPPTRLAEAQAADTSTTTPMRMLRWPPATALTTASRVRLATLMAGKPMSLSELQQRSKESLAVCAAFFDDLKQLQLLAHSAVGAGAGAAGAAERKTTTATTNFIKTTTMPAQPGAVKRGLLARIRLRLGLPVVEP